jgi:hypothetical protein
MFQTTTGDDGIPRRHLLSKKYHGPKAFEVPEPLRMPTPVPVFTPAVPLPVMQVSDVEKQAVREISFNERFSPGAVAARVAAIERETAQMRASREQAE